MADQSRPVPPRSGRGAVISDVRCWLAAGECVWLCTIVGTWGSSPRPVGSWLAVSEQGRWSGSVSGGCLEEDLLRRAVREPMAAPALIDYGISEHDRTRFQLPCGGRIRLLIEPLTPADALGHISALDEALRTRTPVTRRVGLDGGRQLIPAPASSSALPVFDGERLEHPLVPEARLLLIGAGEVARYVAEFAMAADFSVTVCEPRAAFAEGWGHRHIPLTRRLPDDLIRESFHDAWSGVLALAHDPRVDDMGLLAALASPSFYVGAMGSRKTSSDRRARLLALGLDEAVVARLKAPVGIDIPSKTPAEIAIAIVADLIAARHHLRATRSAL